MTKLKVNGSTVEVRDEKEMPLLWVLREKLGLTGTKFGCGIAQCRACTVLVDGEPLPSCALPINSLSGASVTTIEGIGQQNLHPVQEVWINNSVPQCGYCQSGMIIACVALLRKNPNPSDADIDSAIGNLCRCGTYPKIRTAIHETAKLYRNKST